MPGRRVLSDAILKGVHSANVEYEKWSRGWWVTDSGVEGHVVSSVSRSLSKVVFAEEGSLAIEVPFRYIQEWSGANRPRGRPREALRGRRRADIVVFDRSERPICVVEVKRYWARTTCFADLERVRALILRCGEQRGGSLKCGFLAFTVVKGAWGNNQTASERTMEQAEEIRTIVKGNFRREGLNLTCKVGETRDYPARYQDQEQPNWAHAAFCIEIARTT